MPIRHSSPDAITRIEFLGAEGHPLPQTGSAGPPRWCRCVVIQRKSITLQPAIPSASRHGPKTLLLFDSDGARIRFQEAHASRDQPMPAFLPLGSEVHG